MKKKLLSLALAFALCLGLSVPAFAAEAKPGDTTVTDANGVTYQLSKPIVRVDFSPEGAEDSTVYVVSPETTIIPVKCEGYELTESDGFLQFYKSESDNITIWSATLFQGVGSSDKEGLTIREYNSDKYTRYAGFMSQKWTGEDQTQVYTYFTCVEPDAADPAQLETPSVTFTDVPAAAWYADSVAWAVEQGITNGTSKTTFSPGRTCTQGEILTFLWRAQGEPEPAGTVTGTKFYAKAAQWAQEQGLTDAFDGEAPCTRAMVVTYLWKLNGSPEVGAPDFTDVTADAAYGQAVAWAVEQGITNGTSETTFTPDGTCTRGQIVTFLYRAFAD